MSDERLTRRISGTTDDSDATTLDGDDLEIDLPSSRGHYSGFARSLSPKSMDSNQRRHLPLSLRVVAILFILGGISSLIEVIVSMMRSHININFGVLGIFIGIGLYRLRRGWRTCALVFTWTGLIGIPIIGFLFLNHPGPLDYRVFGQKVGHVSKELGVVMALVFFIYTIWQYRILTRKEVRHLFMNRDTAKGREEVHRRLFEKFLHLHPEFRSVDPRIQRSAFHLWVNNPQSHG